MGGRSNINQSKLEAIWKDVQYLIIDEISLISACLLCNISKRLCLVKLADPVAATQPFSGVNVIFLGDFGQLKPVNTYVLFSHELVQNLCPNIAKTKLGQTALYGAFLWQLVDIVIELKKNWQAIGDPAFINLLNRVRSGDCWNGKNPCTISQEWTGINFTKTNFDVINHWQLHYLELHSPTELAQFKLAPIIVTRLRRQSEMLSTMEKLMHLQQLSELKLSAISHKILIPERWSCHQTCSVLYGVCQVIVPRML